MTRWNFQVGDTINYILLDYLRVESHAETKQKQFLQQIQNKFFS